MLLYQKDAQLIAAAQPLPYPAATPQQAKKADALVYAFARPPQTSRAAFAPTDLRQLAAAREDVRFLDCARLDPAPFTEQETALLSAHLARGTLRACNAAHPRFDSLLDAPAPTGAPKRANLLALGDVGSTVLTALTLLGGEVFSRIGICDLNESLSKRWAFEMNQVSLPWDYDRFPAVQPVAPEQLFDCDVFIFVASKGIPPVGSAVADVRMAQFEANAAIVGHYAKMARAASFRGLFAVISDPVDPLAKTALLQSNLDQNGCFDGLGLLPEQVQGFGLGVMNARAAYYAKRDPRFARFLTEGRTFGPHGKELVVADSVAHYDDALSRELTALTVNANMEMRALGYKPYVAPALSSAALSLLLTLRGEWHCGSVFLGGVYMGVKNRYTPAGQQTEALAMPDPLFARIEQAAAALAAIA